MLMIHKQRATPLFLLLLFWGQLAIAQPSLTAPEAWQAVRSVQAGCNDAYR